MTEEFRLHLLMLARNLRKQGRLHPLVIIEGADPEDVLFFDCDSVWGNHPERVALMRRLGGTLGYGMNAQRIFIVVDTWLSYYYYGEDVEGVKDATYDPVMAAWTASGHKLTGEEIQARMDRGEIPPPSQDPNRKQGLQCVEIPKDGPEEMNLQQYTRTKKGLKFEPVKLADPGSFEDYTFGAFWKSVREVEGLLDAVQAMVYGDLEPGFRFKDSGETPDTHKRRAARRTALDQYGKLLFEEHALARRARQWGKAR